MNKSELLKNIAKKGYDAGFSAKLNFATYDIIEKIPGLVSFFTLALGIFALTVGNLPTKYISFVIIVFGLVSLYIRFYDQNKKNYELSGRKLTNISNELNELYSSVKSAREDSDFSDFQKKLSGIEKRYISACISKQILFSKCYAHYKYFWEQKNHWVNEELNLNFFRDKVPLCMWITIFAVIVVAIFWCSDLAVSMRNALIHSPK